MRELPDKAKELLDQVASKRMRQVYEHRIGRLNQVLYTAGDYL
jgi:hypothetical protein